MKYVKPVLKVRCNTNPKDPGSCPFFKWNVVRNKCVFHDLNGLCESEDLAKAFENEKKDVTKIEGSCAVMEYRIICKYSDDLKSQKKCSFYRNAEVIEGCIFSSKRGFCENATVHYIFNSKEDAEKFAKEMIVPDKSEKTPVIESIGDFRDRIRAAGVNGKIIEQSKNGSQCYYYANNKTCTGCPIRELKKQSEKFVEDSEKESFEEYSTRRNQAKVIFRQFTESLYACPRECWYYRQSGTCVGCEIGKVKKHAR